MQSVVNGDISRSNCTGPALGETAQVGVRVNGEDGGLNSFHTHAWRVWRLSGWEGKITRSNCS